MNIKEIIAAERWQSFDRGTKPYVTAHNVSLYRIEAAYQKEYAEWQEGDERLRRMHEEHLAEYDKQIAELEAQLPKVVTPRPSRDGSYYACDCDEDGVGGLYRTDAYCYKCGAKLNWSDV